MTDEEKRYWAYFINMAGLIQYCELCVRCRYGCKQSFRVTGILCEKFEEEQSG